MPPRRKPTSTRQKKANQQLKRAIKRGDAPPPDPKQKTRKPKSLRRGPTGSLIGSAADPSTVAAIQAARRLQSAFITLPPQFLEQTKLLASTLPLHRPISNDVAVLPDTAWTNPASRELSCPRRPKWNFDMTKKQVERNEEGVFEKWLERTDQLVQIWQHLTKEEEIDTQPDENPGAEQPVAMPPSPTYFERNLEVWRQLWRVTEISQIILVLLDSRCPLLHFPPSLAQYLSDQKIILVLTKADIPGHARVEAWISYLHELYPHLRVVPVESYVEKEAGAVHQGRKQFEPHLPQTFRERLVNTIREVHAEMLQPPDKVKNNPAWLKKWKPAVKRVIDWDNVLTARGLKVGSIVGGATVPRTKERDAEAGEEDEEPEYLTVGLIGQPNVGKSSLLNALFGENKVRASRTPGKTKHFQTLFWTPDVRLVDCPGLVMPNLVPMEMQVLCGILPISRVSAVPSCIHHASELLPLERIYRLAHPASLLPPVPDKRTWREGTKPESTDTQEKAFVWTAMDILTAFANAKRWVTAKAGRPDIHRAGNAMLRALAEGKVGWAFWPPGTTATTVTADMEDEGIGLWIPRATIIEEESDQESEDGMSEHDTEGTGSVPEESGEEPDDSDDDRDDKGAGGSGGASGRFGVLLNQDDDETEDEADDDDDGEKDDKSV
ncbi:Guanine nucleotide-binding protein-like 1 [Hypsizygus marmoreus]|uniref:Guanine nucleotide-binding protein-like 1 n=1 Tax=Hypsizygus marmoreus TaxID=39966 RepID=A0A369K7L1_HYPMA|nr:Guanine nucleotide-binding protein-like 1 [Hypsizygus marmoreus]